MALTYAALLTELFPRLTGGIRWGLERTQRMLAHVGDPQRAYRSIHVGGTNGKGSVAAHIESVLRRDGQRVGFYSSPHLCTFRERIRIDGYAIEEGALLAAAERLWGVIGDEAPSFFEATTAIALLALAEADVDVAVIEVGLGGRLDATNVIEPDVTVLTNVSLDHVQLLGSTVADVAREKAGIIKRGVPLVTGEAGTIAGDVFRTTAESAGASIDVLAEADVVAVECALEGTSFTARRTHWGELELTTPLLGAHQATNAALAVRALGALPDDVRPDVVSVREGVALTHWPGRLQLEEIAGATWLFDVAHNVAGVETLAAALAALPVPRPVTVLVGVLGDKDWRGMIAPLHELAERLLLTMPPTAPAERRWDPAEVIATVPSARAEIVADFTTALERAHAHAVAHRGTVVVTGSFHTVGDALSALGRCADGSDVTLPAPAFITTAEDARA